MKLLVTLPWMPYPLSDGGKQGSFNMLEILQDKLDITLVYPVVDKKQLKYEKELFQRLKNVKIYPFKYYGNKGRIRSQFFMYRFHRLFTIKFLKEPYLASPVYEKTYIDFILDIIEKEHIDVVQNEYYEQLFLVYSLPQTVKKIFIQHEIQYINKKRNISRFNPCPSDLLFLYQKVKQEEIAAMNQYNVVVTMTEIDKKVLVNDGVNVPVYPSPSFIPLSDESNFKECNNHILSFIGGAVHYPNFLGIKWFLEKVWPLIVSEDSSMHLQIIGKWNKKQIKSLKGLCGNVTFQGFVPNLSEALSGTIMIVPILIGSGIRMKILEAVNYHSPFIATKVGVEGLNFESGKECFITDEPVEFAKSILKIQSSVALQRELTANAYQKLLKEYSSHVSSEKRFELYKNDLITLF